MQQFLSAPEIQQHKFVNLSYNKNPGSKCWIQSSGLFLAFSGRIKTIHSQIHIE